MNNTNQYFILSVSLIAIFCGYQTYLYLLKKKAKKIEDELYRYVARAFGIIQDKCKNEKISITTVLYGNNFNAIEDKMNGKAFKSFNNENNPQFKVFIKILESEKRFSELVMNTIRYSIYFDLKFFHGSLEYSLNTFKNTVKIPFDGKYGHYSSSELSEYLFLIETIKGHSLISFIGTSLAKYMMTKYHSYETYSVKEYMELVDSFKKRS
ncbi:hypothetical protein KKG82_03695 [Patescibacteria group bacterium]|nr:hypothetical protein [Patescibacteria group bacterium]